MMRVLNPIDPEPAHRGVLDLCTDMPTRTQL